MQRRNGCPPNGSDVKLQAALPRERTSGAPLAAMHKQLTLSVCKRRDAVRLALNEPARPAGAASGVLPGATSSWAAPTAVPALRLGRRGHNCCPRARVKSIQTADGSTKPFSVDDRGRTYRAEA